MNKTFADYFLNQMMQVLIRTRGGGGKREKGGGEGEALSLNHVSIF